MTAQKTQIGAKDPADQTRFDPSSEIPETNVQDAIEAVATSAALDLDAHANEVNPHPQYATKSEAGALARRAFIRARSAQITGDDAGQVARAALGLARRSDVRARAAQFTTDDARQVARVALGTAQRAQTHVNKLNDLQIALKAQVFN